VAIAQRLEQLSVELIGQINKPFASVAEMQPDLVITGISRLDDVSRRSFVAWHGDLPF
jgi:hypothetical protein